MKQNERTIHALAFPILLNYLLSAIFEILDKAIVGHYSTVSFAAVGIGADFVFRITGALGMLCVAFNILAAEKMGKRDEEGFVGAFQIGKKLSLLIGLSFFAISLFGGRFFFGKVYGVEEETISILLSYYYPTSFTVLQNMLIFQYSAYFKNRLNTKITLLQTGVSTAVNLFFDYALVYGAFGFPELGAAGAAWGSVIGLFAGLAVYQITYFKSSSAHIKCPKSTQKESLLNMLKLYPSLLGQELAESAFLALVISATVSNLGIMETAVYSLLESIGSVVMLPIYAYASASQTLSLQQYFAGERRAALDTVKKGIAISVCFAGVLLGLLCTLPKPLMRLILEDAAVIHSAVKLLLIFSLVILIKAPYHVLMSFLQGMGKA